jgi:outer membrane protein assembly factor BamE
MAWILFDFGYHWRLRGRICLAPVSSGFVAARNLPGRIPDMNKFLNLLRGMLLYALFGAGLSACTNMPRLADVPLLLTPYRIDVQQGNLVTQDMVSTLKPGMTRDQVKFVMGTPLITDMFHQDRWDYVYRMQRGRGGAEERKITVYFDKDVLLRVEGDVVPQDSATAQAELDRAKAAGETPPEKKGFFARMRDKLGL